MSRSYKKTPYCGDTTNKKERKRAANQAARNQIAHLEELPQRGEYKKLYSQYDICDYYYSFDSWEDYKKFRLDHGIFGDEEKEKKYYFKAYLRK